MLGNLNAVLCIEIGDRKFPVINRSPFRNQNQLSLKGYGMVPFGHSVSACHRKLKRDMIMFVPIINVLCSSVLCHVCFC